MASSVASEEAYVVPSADPLNAFQDPRASLPWVPNLKKYTVPAESSFLFNIGSWVTMAAITTIGRALFLFHNLEVHNMYVLTCALQSVYKTSVLTKTAPQQRDIPTSSL